MAKDELVRDEFKPHDLNEAGVGQVQELREVFSQVLNNTECICGPGRELSLVKTHLEIALFFAVRAVALNKTFQKE